MPRLFAKASSEFITVALGGLGFALGPCTLTAIIRPTSLSTMSIFSLGTTVNTAGMRFNVNVTTGLLSVVVNSTTCSSITALTAGNWYFVAVTKASGTVAPRFHIYDYATGTWTHENSVTTVANGTTATRVQIGCDQARTGNFFDGDIAAAAVYFVVVSDAELELKAMSFLGFFGPASLSPAAVWIFDQADVTQKVLDLRGGHADESGRTGTAVSTRNAPIFSRGAPVLAAA